MAAQTEPVEVKRSLGLTGATVNAMALIAPGAFLWTTLQIQAAATAPDGSSVATDIWAGIVFALILAFLSAISYAELAKLYPEAGFGSTYYFAEKAFLDRETSAHHRWARSAKLITGWAAHLYYWAYPGVMVAFTATLIGYIYTAVTGNSLSNVELTIIAFAFAGLTGYIASRGVTGSTLTATVINVIQLITLVGVSAFAIVYRHTNPGGNNTWSFSGAWDVVKPHSLTGVLIQSTVAILILVGFESCTALAAETKEPRKNIPRAVILSLVIQGLFAYLLEYFAAGYMTSDQLTATGADKSVVTGLAAVATSAAPLGDMAVLLGNRLLGGLGFGLMISIAVTVVLALIGTTLSCLNTAARVTYAMSKDREMPEILGLLHGQFATPARAIWVLIAVSCVIAAIGVQSVVGLTGITLASNFGTFMLYGLTCLWTIMAYGGTRDSHFIKHRVVPWLGLAANLVMLAAILYLYVIGNADSKKEAYICFGIAGGWAAVSLLYVLLMPRKQPGTTPLATPVS